MLSTYYHLVYQWEYPFMNLLRRLIGSITPIETKIINIPDEIIEVVTPIEKEIKYESIVLDNLTICKNLVEESKDQLNNDPFALCLYTDIETRFKHIDDVFNIINFLELSIIDQVKSPNKNVDLSDYINDFNYRKPNTISLGMFISGSLVMGEDNDLTSMFTLLLTRIENMFALYVPFIEQPTLIEASLSYFDRVIGPFTEELKLLVENIIKIG